MDPIKEFEDEVVDDFLGGRPRAEMWRELKQVLADRLKDASAQYDAVKLDRPNDTRLPELQKQVEQLRQQVTALAEEEAVTQFVEDSVRVTLHKPRPAFLRPGFGDDEDDESGYA